MIYFSKPLNISNIKNNIDYDINIFNQFFISNNLERYNEILYCLKQNVNNSFITNIYLLNERIYTDDELGITSNKIIQINIGERLKFSNVFNIINKNNIKGYNIISNTDIFFDNTLEKLLYSDLHSAKIICALIRYEFDLNNPSNTHIDNIFNCGTQDTWIIHSNNKLNDFEIKLLNFELGKYSCDSAIVYNFNKFNYKIINDPKTIKTYHFHQTNLRNYKLVNEFGSNIDFICPANISIYDIYNTLFTEKNICILIIIIFIILILYNIIFKK